MISPSGSSINRNIVECKVSRACACDIFHLVLIEPLWNVKSGLLWPVLSVLASINRNIMECQRSRTIFYIGILPHFPFNVNPTLNLHSTFAKSIVFRFFHPYNISFRSWIYPAVSGISGDRGGVGPDRGAGGVGWLQGWFCGDRVWVCGAVSGYLPDHL